MFFHLDTENWQFSESKLSTPFKEYIFIFFSYNPGMVTLHAGTVRHPVYTRRATALGKSRSAKPRKRREGHGNVLRDKICIAYGHEVSRRILNA